MSIQPTHYTDLSDVVPEPNVPQESPVRAGEWVDLPSGGRVHLRDPKTVVARERKVMFEGVDFTGGAKADLMFDMLGGVLRVLIDEWDLTDAEGGALPLPRYDADILGGLSIPDITVLEAKAQPVQKMLFPNFQPDVDPTSPTGPSPA